MRLIASAAGLLAFCAAASAQFPPAYGPGGIVVFPGRGVAIFGYVRGGFMTPFGYPGPWGSTVVVTPPPVVMVAPDEERVNRRVQEILNRLPVVPPANERELLAMRRPALVPEPAPRPNFGAAPPLLAPPPAADKGDEADRLARLGKEAFADGEAGRALERFEQAAKADPKKPLPHFLEAQAQVALGRYREAAAAALAGMKLKPDWPAAEFNPRELYGANVADHALDLDRLRQAAERNPQEPSLLFLYGYELWFNGRRAEARTWLEKALPLAADPEPIKRFLDQPQEVKARE